MDRRAPAAYVLHDRKAKARALRRETRLEEGPHVTHLSDPQVRASANLDHALPAAPASAPAARGGLDLRRPPSPSPLEVAVAAIGDGYKAHLVWQLFWGARPFCHLMRRIPGITRKALRSRLGEMERAGLVTRRVMGDGLRRAEYSLTPFGETLKPIVGEMYEWGLKNAPPTPTRIAMTVRGPAGSGAA
jgi:DNA-binding HxlR family transcriptional regulator